MDIRTDLVTVDAGIQQRPIDNEVLKRYMGLTQDGVEFPPVEVIQDGADYYLWDGFHRVECAKRLKRTTIAAHVENGTKRDALWLSFSANKTHGFPRQQGVARRIIEKILSDKSWSKKSLSAIARHVGVTKQYVSLVKSEMVEAQGATTCIIEEAKPSLHRAGEIEVTRGGTTYKQKSQEKQHKADEPPKDAVGRVIPEHLRELWEGRKIVAQTERWMLI